MAGQAEKNSTLDTAVIWNSNAFFASNSGAICTAKGFPMIQAHVAQLMKRVRPSLTKDCKQVKLEKAYNITLPLRTLGSAADLISNHSVIELNSHKISKNTV